MHSEPSETLRSSDWIPTPAFDQLYDEYKDAVFGFAISLTRNRNEAEDLFQDAWLRIVRNIPDKVKMVSLKTWIFTIVANLHKDTLRKKRVRRLFHHTPRYTEQNGAKTDDLLERADTDQIDETDSADIERDINKAIAVLPERLRRVFVLKEIAGFQQAEIGEILGLPVGTVKSLMHRAVKRLQKELSAYNPKTESIQCDAKTLSF